MLPNIAVNTEAMTKLGSDTATYNGVGGISLALQAAPGVPTPTSVPADLTEPTWTGYARVNSPAAPIVPTVDPGSGNIQLTVPPPAGGWNWVTGAGTYPVTIYGWMAVGVTANLNVGYQLFDQPIVLTGSGQQIEVPIAVVQLQAGALS